MAGMKSLAVHSLLPHPKANSSFVDAIHVEMKRSKIGLSLCYQLNGHLESLRLPPQAPAVRADELWKHTCCEAFIGIAGGPSYLEFNFSPSGAFAAYAFSSTRRRDAGADPKFAAPPQIKIHTGAKEFRLSVILPVTVLPVGQRFDIGLSVVVEGVDGTLGYWALNHPSPEPDFHHRAAFALSLDNTA